MITMTITIVRYVTLRNSEEIGLLADVSLPPERNTVKNRKILNYKILLIEMRQMWIEKEKGCQTTDATASLSQSFRRY
jgi:hypothetical protein